MTPEEENIFQTIGEFAHINALLILHDDNNGMKHFLETEKNILKAGLMNNHRREYVHSTIQESSRINIVLEGKVFKFKINGVRPDMDIDMVCEEIQDAPNQ